MYYDLMSKLQDFWNKNSARIPDEKGHSIYAAKKEVDFPRSSMVCDLGGGTGTDSMYFLQKGHRVVLVDIADEPLAKAEARARELGLSDRFKTAQCDFSFGKLPLEDESFDVVYSRLALHYFESKVLSELFAEVYRILRAGASTYITLKSPEDAAEMTFLASTAKEIEDGVFDEDGRIKTRYTIERLQQILINAGVLHDKFDVITNTEKLGNNNDVVKSGNEEFIVNQVTIKK
jgi:ubiquinone/menaquinone biosynthesis C-methylase UbiE